MEIIREHSERDTSRLTRRTLFGGGLILVTSKLVLACSPSPSLPKTEIHITDPTEGNLVPQVYTVRGTFKDLGKDRTIWVMVTEVSGDGNYYPQIGAAEAGNNIWQRTGVLFGRNPNDIGKEYLVMALDVDPDHNKVFRDYLAEGKKTNQYRGFNGLPSASILHESIKVRRDH